MPRNVARRAKALPATSVPALALGAAAFGTIAIGAIAIGALAIGRLVVGRVRGNALDLFEQIEAADAGASGSVGVHASKIFLVAGSTESGFCR